MPSTASALVGWIPCWLHIVDGQPLFRWLHVGDHPFAEPFFDETILRCRSQYPNAIGWSSMSSLAGLVETAQQTPALAPDAFIFHVSRCGSTLLSQLLTIPQQHIVLSEMPLIDEVLRMPYTHPAHAVAPDEQEAALRAVIHLLGRPRTGRETRFFIKLDSWHFAFADTFRRLYPTVPFVLLFRSPDAVLRSHRQQRGMQAVPGLIEPAVFGFEADYVQSLTLDEYTAAVLEHYFRQMHWLAATDPNVHLLNYQPDGTALFGQLAERLHLDLSASDSARIAERSHYHAKHPQQVFSEKPPTEPIPPYLESAMELYGRMAERSKE